ncbi:hypothetical protein F2Q69_00005532 [Brassica cretica]|uniref:Uncharacterized protein n=1 Tax=Brassica cretica TaxID=69181 RepID=A0A8S9P4T7_BRACR|nr:hypothetical protein F2Q69_00005532 [Brassica cretica]
MGLILQSQDEGLECIKKVCSNFQNQKVKPHRLITPDRSRCQFVIPRLEMMSGQSGYQDWSSAESEDRGKAIPTKDRDRVIPERLRLRGAMVRNHGSLNETSSLTPHHFFQVTSRKDHSVRRTVGARVDLTSFSKDSFQDI